MSWAILIPLLVKYGPTVFTLLEKFGPVLVQVAKALGPIIEEQLKDLPEGLSWHTKTNVVLKRLGMEEITHEEWAASADAADFALVDRGAS